MILPIAVQLHVRYIF